MQKPENFDSAKPESFGSFNAPPAGAYILGITKAEVGTTKNSGKEKITLTLDIAEGEFKNYYGELSVKFTKDCRLQYNQLTEGNSTPYFKGMITAIEESNTGYKFNFDEKTLARKLVGAVLQECQYYSKSGELKSILKPIFLCSVATVREGKLKVPVVKPPENKPDNVDAFTMPSSPQHDANEEDLPF
jgi:Protein of unknown function (DUF669)